MRYLGLALPLLLLNALPWINCWLKKEGVPRHFVIILLAVDLILIAYYWSRPQVRIKLLLLAYSIMISYLITEAVYSCYSAVIQARSFYVFDQPVNLVFDPVVGYKYLGRPGRMAYVISDEVQWSITLKGNNYGFADADDFSPHRVNGNRRILVLGDSFTGLPLCDELWPDHVEKLAARDGQRLELLSLARGGYGVSNWTSVLENLVIKEAWDVDEIVFAVYEGDDLERTFVIGGQSAGKPIITHLVNWTIPDPADDAMPPVALDPQSRKASENALLLSKAEYDRFLQNGRPDRYPRRAQQPRFDRLYLFDLIEQPSTWISSYVKDRFLGDSPSSREGGPGLSLTVEMKPIYDRLKAALGRIDKPVKVIYIPYKPEILADNGYMGYHRAKDFAALLGAEFYDGRDAFRPLSQRERAQCFFHIDAHWNQKGSSCFGDYVYRNVVSPSAGQPPIGEELRRAS
jgi:hypothetical protein